jgi:hypothetical protein
VGVLNDLTARITAVEYLAIGNVTSITTTRSLEAEIVAGTINLVTYPIAGLFYNAATEPAGAVNLKRYGEIQAFDVWNQVRRNIARFQGLIDHTTQLPGHHIKYQITDPSAMSNNRLFILLHYEMDCFRCEVDGYLAEVSNTDNNKVYTGQTFKYLTNEQ